MIDKKNSIADESLSAVMDGEAQELELRRLFRDISSSTELREKWFRYHLVSSIIQKSDFSPVTSLEMADSVQLAISQIDSQVAAEAAIFTDEPLQARRWQRGAARFAVAASVAISVVAGLQWQHNGGSSPQVADVHRANTQVSRMEQSKLKISSQALVSQPLLGVMPTPLEASAKSDMIMLYPVQKAALAKDRSEVPSAR